MSDDVELNLGVGGKVVSTEDIGGKQIQRVKIVTGGEHVDDGDADVDHPHPCLNMCTAMSSFYPYGQAATGFASALVDEWGSLQTRSGIVTDAGSCSDDFDAMSTALAGTLTFINGSHDVSGTLSVFSSVLDRTKYIKLDADGETCWALVSTITDDGHVTLATPYQGSSASGAGSWATWRTYTPAGATIVTANSICTLTAPTTAGTLTCIWHDADYGPISDQLRVSVSQRIANQTIRIGWQDVVVSPGAICEIILDGTDATIVKCVSASSSSAGSTNSTTHTLPAGTVTSDSHSYSAHIWSHVVAFYCDGVLITTHEYTIPFPNTQVGIIVAIENTGVAASPTSVAVHWMHYDDTERVDSLVTQTDPSKLQMTSQGRDAVGSQPTGKPVLMAGTDAAGAVQAPRIDAVRNQTVSLADPTDAAARQAVKHAADMTGDEQGAVVNSLVYAMAQALLRPIKVMSDVLSMAQDTVGRLRGLVDINSGTVTTVTTVTTCATVTSLTNLNGQSVQSTLLYDTEQNMWSNTVRRQIT